MIKDFELNEKSEGKGCVHKFKGRIRISTRKGPLSPQGSTVLTELVSFPLGNTDSAKLLGQLHSRGVSW